MAKKKKHKHRNVRFVLRYVSLADEFQRYPSVAFKAKELLLESRNLEVSNKLRAHDAKGYLKQLSVM